MTATDSFQKAFVKNCLEQLALSQLGNISIDAGEEGIHVTCTAVYQICIMDVKEFTQLSFPI